MAEKKTVTKVPEMETVFLPRISGEENTVFVGVNGRSWQIPRGKKVEVPAHVARVLDEADRNARIASAYAQSCQQAEPAINSCRA